MLLSKEGLYCVTLVLWKQLIALLLSSIVLTVFEAEGVGNRLLQNSTEHRQQARQTDRQTGAVLRKQIGRRNLLGS